MACCPRHSGHSCRLHKIVGVLDAEPACCGRPEEGSSNGHGREGGRVGGWVGGGWAGKVGWRRVAQESREIKR